MQRALMHDGHSGLRDEEWRHARMGIPGAPRLVFDRVHCDLEDTTVVKVWWLLGLPRSQLLLHEAVPARRASRISAETVQQRHGLAGTHRTSCKAKLAMHKTSTECGRTAPAFATGMTPARFA